MSATDLEKRYCGRRYLFLSTLKQFCVKLLGLRCDTTRESLWRTKWRRRTRAQSGKFPLGRIFDRAIHSTSTLLLFDEFVVHWNRIRLRKLFEMSLLSLFRSFIWLLCASTWIASWYQPLELHLLLDHRRWISCWPRVCALAKVCYFTFCHFSTVEFSEKRTKKEHTTEIYKSASWFLDNFIYTII